MKSIYKIKKRCEFNSFKMLLSPLATGKICVPILFLILSSASFAQENSEIEISKTDLTSINETPFVISDNRLKQDIQQFDSGLSDLLNVQPVWFRYSNKSGLPDNIKHVGVIAQDLQKIFPYMISTYTASREDATEYLAIDQSAFSYLLINAVKELAAQNEKLKSENELLKISTEEKLRVLDEKINSLILKTEPNK